MVCPPKPSRREETGQDPQLRRENLLEGQLLCIQIRTQLVEQQKCLDQQTEMRVQLLQDLQDFFRKKAEIEMEYSRNLEKLAERFMPYWIFSSWHLIVSSGFFRKDQNLLSPVNCWYLLLNQVRRESKDHATLSDIYLNNVIMRFMQISEDSTRLLKKVRMDRLLDSNPLCRLSTCLCSFSSKGHAMRRRLRVSSVFSSLSAHYFWC
uniref:F-BAR domain-containing protein n=1 Tax=Poecilia latipinna TaxID=48699 RepID=A0A3B3VND9_9TELE